MLTLVLTLSLLIAPVSDEDTLSECREIFFRIDTEKEVETLIRLSKPISERQPAAMAYQGAAKAMQADYALNPYKKWSCFNDGKDLIEEAVKRDSKNAEIRFLRLGVQLFTPAFLGYDENIEDDTQIICTALKNGWMNAQQGFRKQIIDFMLTHAPLSSSQRNELERLK